MRRRLLSLIAALLAWPAAAQTLGPTVEVGETGFAVKRPVMASACPHGCPWGELGEFVQAAVKPLGYEVILCRNCNRAEGPRVVGRNAYPPPLIAQDLLIGTTSRVNARVDFGVTESGFLNAAYRGEGAYQADGPYRNLRLIAKLEDPMYLLVAVKRGSGITDLGQIRERRMPVRILSAGGLAGRVLEHYGLTRAAVESWGGQIGLAMGAPGDAPFDVIISDLGSPANNLESNHWTRFSQLHDLQFLELPEPLLAELARTPGVTRVTAKWGLLRGIERPIATVARSGEVIFARDDTPEQAAYDLARAIDAARAELRWYQRPYSYDPRTVWKNLDVPLHPGAARYYREAGYMP